MKEVVTLEEAAQLYEEALKKMKPGEPLDFFTVLEVFLDGKPGLDIESRGSKMCENKTTDGANAHIMYGYTCPNCGAWVPSGVGHTCGSGVLGWPQLHNPWQGCSGCGFVSKCAKAVVPSCFEEKREEVGAK